MAGKFWTNLEENSLKKLYEEDGLSPSEISILLDRSCRAITLKIQRLKLKHDSEQKSQVKKRTAREINSRKVK